jgi:WD40 repeat protein
MAWLKDGTLLINFLDAETVSRVDIESGAEIERIDGSEAVSSIQWSADDTHLLAGTINGAAIWDVGTRSLAQYCVIATAENAFDFFRAQWMAEPNLALIESLSFVRADSVWDIETCEPVDVSLPREEERLSLSPDRRYALTLGAIKRLYDLKTGEKLGLVTLDREISALISPIYWSPDSTTLSAVVKYDDGHISLNSWNIPQEAFSERHLLSIDDAAGVAAWSDASGKLAYTTGITVDSPSWPDTQIHIFDPVRGTNIPLNPVQRAGSPRGNILLWSPDGSMVAIANVLYGSAESGYCRCGGSSTAVVHVFDGTTGGLIRTLHGHTVTILAMAWSPDGQTLATASGDGTINLWPLPH